MDDISAIRFLTEFLLPPTLQLLLILAGLVGRRRWRRVGSGLVVLGLGSLAILALPVVGGALMMPLQPFPALSDADLERMPAGAIVVLSADRYWRAPEYGGDTIGALTLGRLRYGVHLHRATSLPLLLSGGLGDGEERQSLAYMMKQVAETDFGVFVTWTEEESRNTWENARYSGDLLAEEGIDSVLLVSHAWHLPRAMEAFRRVGLEPIPAPTQFATFGFTQMGDWLPSPKALGVSQHALHEYLGRLWYRIRY